MATNRQRIRNKMIWIYSTHGAGTTGHRKTEADTFQDKLNLPDYYVASLWKKMRGDVVK